MIKWTDSILSKTTLIIALGIAITLFVISWLFLPEFSSFAAGILKVSVAMTMFFLFDKYLMKEIDTIEELKKNNIAYAIFLLCFAILVAAAMSSV